METKWILAGIAAIAVVLGGGWYFAQNKTLTNGTNQQPVTTRELKTYYDERYGIAFNFPDNYEVQEKDSTEGTKHHTIIVGDKAALANVPADSEGPPVITIDIFPNAQNKSPEAWVKGTANSNFKLSPDSKLTPLKISNLDAVAYGWDGLYRSTSIVLNRAKQIYMFSVGSNGPTDQIVQDYAQILASVQFDP